MTNANYYSDNTTYLGGTGNDTMAGQYYTNTYVFNAGDGQGAIYEDGSSNYADVLQFGSGIADDQLWFRHVGNDLEVSVIGAGDSSTIKNWYSGNGYHIEQFKTSNGKTLLDSQVQNLVDAMAGFSPPAAGQTSLPPNYASSLATVIATNWQ